MLTRHTVVEQFSAFMELTDNRFCRWLVDPRLNRSMTKAIDTLSKAPPLERHPDSNSTHTHKNTNTNPPQAFIDQERLTQSNFWTIYWHREWQMKPNSLAYHHLMAFAQESCYWAALKISTGFSSTQYALSDCFQVAIAGFPKILRSFSPHQNAQLDTYARRAFGNIIRDTLRQRKETDICSDWSLLRKLSQKRLQEAIASAGQADRGPVYILAWQCFKDLYVPDRSRSTKQLEGPDASTWDAIAQQFQKSVSSDQMSIFNPPGDAIASTDATTLKKWLLLCATMARAYLYPKAKSLNAPKLGADSGELQDSIPEIRNTHPETGPMPDLLAAMIAQEEQHQRQAQRTTIKQVLEQAISQLKPEAQMILKLYYGQGFNQQDIAQVLNIKQYTVSRRLRRIKETLIKQCATWSEQTLHISLTSDVLESIGLVIDEWLCSHHAAQPEQEREY